MNLTIGVECDSFHDLIPFNADQVDQALFDVLQHVTSNGYGFLMLPIVERSFLQRNLSSSNTEIVGFYDPLQDLIVTDGQHSDLILPIVSPELTIYAEDSSLNNKKLSLFKQELQWIGHIGIHQVILNARPDYHFAQLVLHTLDSMPYLNVLVRVSAKDWKVWNLIRTMCSSHSRLSVALDVTDMETVPLNWIAEPVKLVVLSTSSFIQNNSGFPVLRKKMQHFITSIFSICQHFAIKGAMSSENPDAYHRYIRHLHQSRPEKDEMEKFAEGYDDYLQMPLQPLMDNLDNGTYEVFETDPVKYALYEEAVGQALMDLKSHGLKIVRIAVVGAGRGPLVQRCLNASLATEQPIVVYAVEKNANAMVGLQKRMLTDWKDCPVQLIHQDMRNVVIEPVDILVSELLGSFADNELSPECLDGAQRLLRPNGISIPSSYTPFACPMSSAKLHHSASAYKDLVHVETPYVVKFRQVHLLSDTLPVWTFHHPTTIGNNDKSAKVSFHVKEDSLIHGFAGFFECTLYKHVLMSTNPSSHSPGMLSWFPIYFPIKTPMIVNKGDDVDICIWRRADGRKVWYEWSMTILRDNQVLNTTPIHNPAGRSYWIGL